MEVCPRWRAAWEGAILEIRSRCWRHGRHVCRFEWPHQPQEWLGGHAQEWGEQHCSWPWIAMAGCGTHCPRAKAGCPGLPRVGVPCGRADFWEPPSSTDLWHTSAVAIGGQRTSCRAGERVGRLMWECQEREMWPGSSFVPNQILSSAHFLYFLPCSSSMLHLGQPLSQCPYQSC